MKGKGSFDFIRYQKYFIGGSILFILCGIIAFVLNGGFNYGVDFEGGGIVTIHTFKKEERKVSVEELKRVFSDEVDVSPIGSDDVSDQFNLKIKVMDKEKLTDPTIDKDSELNKIVREEIINPLNKKTELGTRGYSVLTEAVLDDNGFGKMTIETVEKKPSDTTTEQLKNIFDEQIEEYNFEIVQARGLETINEFHIRFPAPEITEKTLEVSRSIQRPLKKALKDYENNFKREILIPLQKKFTDSNLHVDDGGVKTSREGYSGYLFVRSAKDHSVSDFQAVLEKQYNITKEKNEASEIIYKFEIDLSKTLIEEIRQLRQELVEKVNKKITSQDNEEEVKRYNFNINYKGKGDFIIGLKKEYTVEELSQIVARDLVVEPYKKKATEKNDKFVIKFQVLSTYDLIERHVQDKIETPLLASLGSGGYERADTEYYNPSIGEQLKSTALLSSALVILMILLYIALRFRFNFSIGAIVCLLHDMLIILSFNVLTGGEVNVQLVIAVLTVLGFSINDTIIVFDRIRESMEYSKAEDFTSVVNRSITQTLSRTIITSVTTLLADLALVFLGGDALYDLSIALLIGIISGTYSSIYIASPVVIWLEKRRKQKDKDVKNEKLAYN